MEQKATKNTAVSKKVLSVFLAVLMTFSVFSICLPNLAVSADAAPIDNLKQALNAYAYSGETENYTYSTNNVNTVTIIDNTSKGYVYNVLVVLQPVLEQERNNGYNWFSKLRRRVIEITGASGASITLLERLIPMLNDNWYATDESK